MTTARRVRGCLTAAILIASSWGCGSGRAEAERTIFSFVTAVQTENLDALQCLLAGASEPTEDQSESEARRSVFDDWARSRYAAYLAGRDRGGVEFDDDGIVLTKAFALGKGAYYEVVRVRQTEESLVADTEVRLAYQSIDISVLPPGTTFYACAAPPGRILALEIPRAGTVTADVIDAVHVRFTLVRSAATPHCPERLAVAAVELLPGTVESREITWEF